MQSGTNTGIDLTWHRGQGAHRTIPEQARWKCRHDLLGATATGVGRVAGSQTPWHHVKMQIVSTKRWIVGLS